MKNIIGAISPLCCSELVYMYACNSMRVAVVERVWLIGCLFVFRSRFFFCWLISSFGFVV